MKKKRKNKTKSANSDLTLRTITSSEKFTDAMKTSSFYNAVTDKAETIGQLPVKMYKSLPDGSRQQITKGRLWRIFTQKPCEYLTMQGFLEMMVTSLEYNGSFYAYKELNDLGSIMSIIPFSNQRGIVPSMDLNGNVYYVSFTNDGKYRDPYSLDDLVRITKFTLDGYTPIRPILYQATLLGISNAQDLAYRDLQENGITSQMALSTTETFTSEEAINRLKESWGPTGDFRGVNGRRNIPIFENGLVPIKLQLTPQETDLLNNKKFTNEQIYSMVGVPEYRIKLEKVSVGVLPELDEFYLRNKLNPIIRKFESAMNELLPEGTYIEVDRKAFYAGSPWRLVEHVEKEVRAGLATVNEGRIDLGRERVEGADVFAIDSNNVTYGTWPELESIREQINGRSVNNGVTNENQ